MWFLPRHLAPCPSRPSSARWPPPSCCSRPACLAFPRWGGGGSPAPGSPPHALGVPACAWRLAARRAWGRPELLVAGVVGSCVTLPPGFAKPPRILDMAVVAPFSRLTHVPNPLTRHWCLLLPAGPAHEPETQDAHRLPGPPQYRLATMVPAPFAYYARPPVVEPIMPVWLWQFISLNNLFFVSVGGGVCSAHR